MFPLSLFMWILNATSKQLYITLQIRFIIIVGVKSSFLTLIIIKNVS